MMGLGRAANAIDWLLTKTVHATHENQFRSRFLAALTLIAALTASTTGSFVLWLSDPSGWVTLIYGALTLVALGLLRAGLAPRGVFWIFQVITALHFLACRALQDRLDWPLVMWLAVFPVMGILFGGLLEGVGGLALAVVTGVGLYQLEHTVLLPQVKLSPLVSIERGVSFIGALFLITLVFDALRTEALRRAEEAATARTLFLANMSHELRTPMNGVIGITELLLAGALPADVRVELELLKRSGAQMVNLVNDILDLSRLESGRVVLEPLPTNLSALLGDVVSLLKPIADDKHLNLSVEVTGELPAALLLDPTRLRQVVTNLIANALKFTSRGEVRVRAAFDNERLQVAVQDTGIGISAQTLARLFVPFEQADVSYTRRFGGSGLGLALSQRLLAMMGGRLEVTSREGQGSTFSFEIPAQPCAPAAELPPPAVGAVQLGHRVLVVEDNAINRHVALAMLSRCGCRTVVAHDGAEALEALVRQAPFDLVLMDCHMPNMDGFEATRQIRALPGATAKTRVVALTASAMSEELEHCQAAGMDAVLTKPLTLSALQQVLARLGSRPEAG